MGSSATDAMKADQEQPLLEPHDRPLGPSHGPSGGKRCTWLQTTSALLTLQLGWGLWLLPSDFAKLGWALGLGCLFTLATLTCYSGNMFSRLYAAVPSAVLLGDIGEAAVGKHGRTLVYLTIYSLDATRCIILHLAASESLLHAFPEASRPALWECAIIVAIVVLAIGQKRSLTQLSWFFMIGTGAQLIALAIVVADILANPDRSASCPVIPEDLSTKWRDAITAAFNMVFAFGGQFAFLEIITSMARPSQFPRAVGLCTAIMTLLYGGLGAAGYWSKGNKVSGIVVFHVDGGEVMARTAAGLIFLQALAQYLVNLNIWTHNLLVLLGRRRAALAAAERQRECAEVATLAAAAEAASARVNGNGANGANGHATIALDSQPTVHYLPADETISEFPTPDTHSATSWLAATAFVAAYSALIAVAVPFFSTLVALVTSVTYLTCAYTLPCWFSLHLLKDKMLGAERLLLRALIVLSVLASAIGLYASVWEYVVQATGGGAESFGASSGGAAAAGGGVDAAAAVSPIVGLLGAWDGRA